MFTVPELGLLTGGLRFKTISWKHVISWGTLKCQHVKVFSLETFGFFRKKRNFCCSSGKYTSSCSHSRWADSKVLTTPYADFNQSPQLHPCALFSAVPSTPNTEFLQSSILFQLDESVISFSRLFF